jgi:hypothetical protein
MCGSFPEGGFPPLRRVLRRGDRLALAADLIGEAWGAGVSHPDLNGAQAGCSEPVAGLADPFRRALGHQELSIAPLHVAAANSLAKLPRRGSQASPSVKFAVPLAARA